MDINRNLSNSDIKVLNDIFHHLNETNQLSLLLVESFLNSKHITKKLQTSIKFLNKFEEIFIYINSEKLLLNNQYEAERNLWLILNHLEISQSSLETFRKLIKKYKNTLSKSSELLNQKINLEKIIEY